MVFVSTDKYFPSRIIFEPLGFALLIPFMGIKHL